MMQTAQTTRSQYRNVANHKREHVVIAEQVLGKPMPKGVEIHHVNGVKDDNRHTNLVICQDHAYHALLHARTRVLRAGGDPNRHRICADCKQLELISEFGPRHNQCNLCRSVRMRALYHARRVRSDQLCRCGCGQCTFYDPVRKRNASYILGHMGPWTKL